MNLEVLESVEEVLETVLEYFDIEIISCKDHHCLLQHSSFLLYFIM